MTSRLLQVREGVTQRFWVEDGVLYAKDQRPYVSKSCEFFRSKLLSENHDTPWAGSPGQQRTLAFLSWSFYWRGFFFSVCKNLSCLSVGQGWAAEDCRLVETVTHSREAMSQFIYGLYHWITKGEGFWVDYLTARKDWTVNFVAWRIRFFQIYRSSRWLKERASPTARGLVWYRTRTRAEGVVFQ